jgi:hypothetical protein
MNGVFTILFFVFAAVSLCLLSSTAFVSLVAAHSPSIAVVYEDEEPDDEDEPGEPIRAAEPQPSSDGGVPRDEFPIDWDELDAARAAHEDRAPALTT